MLGLRSLVESQFTGSRLGRAVLFFLLPTILWAVFSLAFALAINPQGLALSIGLGLLSWVAISLALFVLVRLFKGKDAKVRFSSVLAAFSVNYLIAAVAGLFVIALIFVSFPGFFQKVSSLQGQDLTQEQMASVVSSLALPGDAMFFIIFAAISLILLGAGIACVAVLYRIGSLAKETSRFSNLVFAVLSLGIIIGVDYALRAILGLLL